MSKTSYIVVINPAYDFIEVDNQKLAEALYISKNKAAHDVAIVPRSAFKPEWEEDTVLTGIDIFSYRDNYN